MPPCARPTSRIVPAPVGTIFASSRIVMCVLFSTVGVDACSDIATGITASEETTAANAKPVSVRASKLKTNN